MRMRSVCLAAAIVLLSLSARSLWSQPNTGTLGLLSDISGGTVSGVWTLAGSPYRIGGEITIPNDSTLTIEPGVEVIFTGHYKFNVQGRLLAVGTQQDSIHFAAENTQTGWHGIRFHYTPNTNDSSIIAFCSFRHGNANTGDSSGPDRCGGAISIRGFGKVSVSNSMFEYNMNDGNISAATGGAAIYVADASPTITKSVFRHNTGTTDCAILCWRTNAVISNNIFADNSGPHGPVFCAYYSPTISANIISRNVTTRAGGGIFTMTTTATITNNIIIGNQCFGGEGEGGGIKCWIDDKPVIINNTIAYNNATLGGGICCNQNADPLLINNIVWGNTANYGNQVNCLEGGSDPNFLFCDVQGGKVGFGGTGSGVYYTGTYENNVDADPLFRDTAAVDFRLSDASPCISAGIDSVEIGGVWYHVPRFCFIGNPRPSPAGTDPDIGACESLLGFPGLAYAHDVRLTRYGRDTVGITARVENPLAHTLNVVGIFNDGSGAPIDSVFLKDDGLHGDGAAADSVWGMLYAPTIESLIRVTIRTDDVTLGKSRALSNVVEFFFTHKALVSMDTRTVALGNIYHALSRFDTTFQVDNLGWAEDSIYVSLDPILTPDSAISVSPPAFTLAPGGSQTVTFSVMPHWLSKGVAYNAVVIIDSRFGFGQTHFEKAFSFGITAVSDDPPMPSTYAIYQNYPNPFNPSTTIKYELPHASFVSLKVYNTLGQQVASLVDEGKTAGAHMIQFEGSGLASGVYVYRIQAGDYVGAKRMLLLR